MSVRSILKSFRVPGVRGDAHIVFVSEVATGDGRVEIGIQRHHPDGIRTLSIRLSDVGVDELLNALEEISEGMSESGAISAGGTE